MMMTRRRFGVINLPLFEFESFLFTAILQSDLPTQLARTTVSAYMYA